MMTLQLTLTFDLEEIDRALWQTFCLWRKYNMKHLTEVENISQCQLQMMLLRVKSLRQMMNGVPLYLDKPEARKVLDIASMASVVRGIYETAFIYHNIFISADSEDERDLLICIWRIRGFNNTQGVPAPEGMENLQRLDAESIAIYKRKANEIASRLNISEKARRLLDGIINDEDSNLRGYKFVKDEDNQIVNIEKKSFSKPELLFGHKMYDNLYSYMSLFSHPSFLGMKHFADMFNNGKDRGNAENLIKTTCICASKFISDFCTVVSNGQLIWKEVNPHYFTLVEICSNL
jgi:hypothetical protein